MYLCIFFSLSIIVHHFVQMDGHPFIYLNIFVVCAILHNEFIYLFIIIPFPPPFTHKRYKVSVYLFVFIKEVRFAVCWLCLPMPLSETVKLSFPYTHAQINHLFDSVIIIIQ